MLVLHAKPQGIVIDHLHQPLHADAPQGRHIYGCCVRPGAEARAAAKQETMRRTVCVCLFLSLLLLFPPLQGADSCYHKCSVSTKCIWGWVQDFGTAQHLLCRLRRRHLSRMLMWEA